MLIFPQTRDDGWPLCPQCEQDEVYSMLVWDGEGAPPPLDAYVAAGMACYFCAWTYAGTAEKDPHA